MKRTFAFFKKHSWMVILLACLVFIPQSFSYQAKLNMRVVVTGLAIDKSEDGYEVTAQVVMPSPGSESGGTSANLDFISEQGDSVAEGIQKIAYKIGKEAGLSHTDFVLLGESMLKDNVVPVLDYFARDDTTSPALMLLVCEGSAKEMIKQTANLELSVGVGLRKVFLNKENSLSAIVTGVDEFINDSFSVSSTSIISGVVIAPEGKEDKVQGQSSASSSALPGGSQNGSSSEQGSSSGGSGQQKSARIKFYNDVYYFVDGKNAGKLSDEKAILGMFYSRCCCTNGEFKVEGVNGGILQDAVVGLQFSDKSVKKTIDIKDEKPILRLNVELGSVRVEEILLRGEPSISIYDKQNKAVASAIKSAIKEEIKTSIEAAFETAQKDNADIFHIGDMCYQYKPKEFKKLLDKRGENYLKDAEIKVTVDIKNYI